MWIGPPDLDPFSNGTNFSRSQGVPISLEAVPDDWPSISHAWWGAMSTAAIVNIITFMVVFQTTWDPDSSDDDAVRSYQAFIRKAGIPYVLTNALRSFFPAWYPGYFVFWDTPLSSIGLHRACATVAEVLWVVQIITALNFCLSQVEHLTKPRAVQSGWNLSWPVTSILTVGTICTAQCFSWVGTITQSQLWFFMEQLLWGVAFTILLPASYHLLYACYGACKARPRASGFSFAVALAVVASTFVPYIFIRDIWQYWSNHQEQVNTGFVPNSFLDGVQKAFVHRTATQSWAIWGPTVIFSLPYFILGSWAAMGMMTAPRLLSSEDHKILATLGKKSL